MPEFFFKSIELKENSTFSEPYRDSTIQQYKIYGESIDIGSGSTMILGVNSDMPVINLQKYLFVSTSSSIKYDKEITIISNDRITLRGNLIAINFDVMPRNDMLMTKVIAETKLIVDENVIIHCYTCIFIGLEDIVFSGRILNDRWTCLNDSK
jgi:hypothetical protein